MSTFEFLFSLFGLLLGFGLADVLGGFSRAFKSRKTVRVGYLTPLLGLILLLDITSFWMVAWSLRGILVPKYWVLMLGLVCTGLYYLAATLVFPGHDDRKVDYDRHYFANRKWVIGIMFVINLPEYVFDWILVHSITADWLLMALSFLFFISLAGIFFARGKRTNLVFLLMLIANYVTAMIEGALTT